MKSQLIYERMGWKALDTELVSERLTWVQCGENEKHKKKFSRLSLIMSAGAHK